MEKWNEHELLNVDSVKAYVIDKGYFTDLENLTVQEIGDGNINYVFKITDEDQKKSIILKQADVLLRSSGRPLSVIRSKIEATILKYYNEAAGGYTPEVYGFDENMCVIAMEDVSDYVNMRKEMLKRSVFPSFSEDISDFMLKVLIPTLDLCEDAEKKKERVGSMINPELCKISEDLVFTEPYVNYKNRNIITDGNESFVEEYLYNDIALHTEVAKLKEEFMNNAQGLVHGDLHMGSIFINDKGLKVIDPEFAFYGPIGYDIGNVIGNLFFGIAYNRSTEGYSGEFEDWVLVSASEIFDNVKYGLKEKLTPENIVDPIRKTVAYIDGYIESIMAYSMGVAGLEIIRRTVGDAKVLELNTLEDNLDKLEAERLLIKLGIRFIKDRYRINRGESIIEMYRELASHEK